MDISLQDSEHPLPAQNLVQFPQMSSIPKEYNLIFYMTDYFIDSVMNVAFYAGVLSANVPTELFELDTTVLDAALLG